MDLYHRTQTQHPAFIKYLIGLNMTFREVGSLPETQDKVPSGFLILCNPGSILEGFFYKLFIHGVHFSMGKEYQGVLLGL